MSSLSALDNCREEGFHTVRPISGDRCTICPHLRLHGARLWLDGGGGGGVCVSGGAGGGGRGQRAREASQVPETVFITARPCKQAAIRGLIAATVAEGMDSFRY